MANVYANGLMLPSAPDSSITPLSVSECRSVFGNAVPSLDDFFIRADALTMVNMLSGVPQREAALLCRPPIEKSNKRIWYARHAGYGAFDPLAAALALAGEVKVHPSPPSVACEFDACDAIVVAGPRQNSPLPAQQQIGNLLKVMAGRPKPFIYLSGTDPQGLAAGHMGRCHRLPVQLPDLVAMLRWSFATFEGQSRNAAA
jgi:hypothetical protein